MTIKLGVFHPELISGAWFDPDTQAAGWWDDELVDTAAASGAMSASTSVTFSTAGALTGAGALSGTTSPTFTTAGNLTGMGALAGSLNVVFTTAATGVATAAASGSVSVTFTTSGAVTGAGALSGSTSPAFTTSGTLAGAGALSGSTAPAFSVAGTLAGTGALSGSLDVVFSPSATAALEGAISGSASVAFDASGTLTGETGTTSLSGRRVRGKRILFPDEIDDPHPTEETAPPPRPVVIDLVTPARRIEEHRAEASRLLARIAEVKRDTNRRKAERARAIAALQGELAGIEAAIAASEEAERRHVARIRDEDEFWLLAA